MAIPTFQPSATASVKASLITAHHSSMISLQEACEFTSFLFPDPGITDLDSRSTSAAVICEPPISTPNTTDINMICFLIFIGLFCTNQAILSIGLLNNRINGIGCPQFIQRFACKILPYALCIGLGTHCCIQLIDDPGPDVFIQPNQEPRRNAVTVRIALR